MTAINVSISTILSPYDLDKLKMNKNGSIKSKLFINMYLDTNTCLGMKYCSYSVILSSMLL